MGTCLVIAVKFNEEVCFINDKKRRFYYDSDFAPAVQIPVPTLVDFQLHFLKTVDHELFVTEEEYLNYVQMFMEMAGVIREE